MDNLALSTTLHALTCRRNTHPDPFERFRDGILIENMRGLIAEPDNEPLRAQLAKNIANRQRRAA